jgi:predicted glycosyltransferase
MEQGMRFLIDLTNSPHVLFFEPIVRKLEADGHEVLITARDFAQTLDLIKKRNLKATVFGKHMGRSVLKKAFGLIYRSALLYFFGKKVKPDVALSHNSNDLAVAARLLGVPHLIFVDYEYASFAHKFNSFFADRILFPEPVPVEKLVQLYGKEKKFGNYPGLKEQVYLPHHELKCVRDEIGVSEEEVLVVVRPPADFALYHRFENPLFENCLEYLESSEAKVVILPRTSDQKERLEEKFPDFFYPEKAVDGPSLIFSADLVLSAGGTMNREAAVLGTPAYTIFAGLIGAVDAYLMEKGLLKKVDKPEDIEIRKKASKGRLSLESTLDEIVQIIYQFAEERVRR